MKKRMTAFLVLLLLALSLPGLALAQDFEFELTQTYTTADGTFSIGYPAGWLADGVEGGLITIRSSTSVDIDTLADDETFPSGEIAIAIAIPSVTATIGIDANADPVEVVELLGEGFLDANSLAAPQAETVSAGGYTVTLNSDEGSQSQRSVLAIAFPDGILAIAVETAPGELTNYTNLMIAMLQSIQYTPGASAGGEIVRQWASGASGTSQYGEDSWSFMQATGEPDTDACGDFTTAWASSTSTGNDILALEFDQEVIATQINIYETYNPGSIVRVDVGNSDTGDVFELPNSADPPGNTECPGVFTVDVTAIDTPVDRVIIYLDQSIGGSWNEIDAVELVGEVPGEAMPAGGSLSYGDTVTGELNQTQDQWTFDGVAGDVVSIAMTSPDFDTYLELNGPDGQQVIVNDDGGEGLNSLIEEFALPTTGTYTIIARSFGDRGVGSYELSLTSGGAAVIPTGSSIAYGDTVTSSLNQNQEEWTFNGSLGDIVTIAMTSTDFDTYLELNGPDGQQLIVNDDGGEGLNSLIEGFVLPVNGTYTIIARSFASAGTGNYTLSLTTVGGVSAPTGSSIAFGDTVTGTLNQTQDSWTFEGSAGDSVTISMTSTDFDTYLELYGPDGQVVTTNDDGGQGLNSLIENFVLPANGTYTIVARSFANAGTGSYTLSLATSGADSGSAPTPGTHTFANGGTFSYPLDWEAQDDGDIFELTTSDGAVNVEVYAPPPLTLERAAAELDVTEDEVGVAVLTQLIGSYFPYITVIPANIVFEDINGAQTATYTFRTNSDAEVIMTSIVFPNGRLGMVKAEISTNFGLDIPQEVRDAMVEIIASFTFDESAAASDDSSSAVDEPGTFVRLGYVFFSGVMFEYPSEGWTLREITETTVLLINNDGTITITIADNVDRYEITSLEAGETAVRAVYDAHYPEGTMPTFSSATIGNRTTVSAEFHYQDTSVRILLLGRADGRIVLVRAQVIGGQIDDDLRAVMDGIAQGMRG